MVYYRYMNKLFSKILRKNSIFFKTEPPAQKHPINKGEISIDKKVEKILDKATTEYRETFEKLAEYDKQS